MILCILAVCETSLADPLLGPASPELIFYELQVYEATIFGSTRGYDSRIECIMLSLLGLGQHFVRLKTRPDYGWLV